MILHTSIIYILRFLAGIDSATWARVLDWVRQAEHDLQALATGAERKDWVVAQLRTAMPNLGQWVVDLLVGLAAGYCGRKGWIHLSK